MNDPTPGHVANLHPRIQPLAVAFINALREAGYPAIITSSRRGQAEQARLVRAGRSATYNSRHLTGLAFDMDIMGMDRNQIPRWFWDAVGPFGESLGLRWGGRWRVPYDPGHFELSR